MCGCEIHWKQGAVGCTCTCPSHAAYRREDAARPLTGVKTVAIGGGDESDVEAGRCCPTCRHSLSDHNRAVWDAGYAVGARHEREIRSARDGGAA